MSLLNIVKSDGNLRKLFGKRELKIIEKQLLGLQLKASEKTRLSRDIRKKFEAVKSLMPFADEFSLKHGKEIIELTNDVKEAILRSKYFPKVRRIMLFGSVVKNELTLDSDIDMAVEFDKINLREATEFRLDILKNVSDKADVQVFNVLPDKIKKEILKKRRIIYEKKN